ncbi:MAG TPA: aminotransferase class I/II-fold pyridoxal phosphate-dependent enzyme [Polyangia bacterium]|jgi:arginine decarboxylase
MDATRVKQEGGAALLSDAASPAHLRIDLWNRIREGVDRIAEARTTPGEDHHLEIEALFRRLAELERLWAYPGAERIDRLRRLYRAGELGRARALVSELVDRLSELGDRAALVEDGALDGGASGEARTFTVLLVDAMSPERFRVLRRNLRALRDAGSGDLLYEVVRVGSFEEAWLAVMCNTDIQAVVMRHSFPVRAARPITSTTIRSELDKQIARAAHGEAPLCDALAAALRHLRPELDLYLLTNESLGGGGEPTARLFSRVFYRFEDAHELHVSILDGVRARMKAPFFDALRAYAERPIGNFHALPIARGHSVRNSQWIRDFGRFYGDNLFMAESSSTAGGLDSLLEPTGTIKEAQELAARCFGARQTFFVTNGTSTANKIVHMALLRPGDIVLIDRNCHKSHHYGLALAGARPVYLDAYPLQRFAIYGGVPLRALKQALLQIKRAGQLERVRLLVLTNVTFDGVVYQPERVMEELLAIHPRLCFLWDEAWFAYARFLPLMRRRTGMAAARALGDRLASRAYREEYRAFRASLGHVDTGLDGLFDAQLLERRLLPDPDQAIVRVYVTQSTHKSLSAFRQASMIHVRDELFEREASAPFTEAYLAHTTTSPNHQLVGSLDVARKQMELEGFAMVKEAYQLALRMRDRVALDPLISRYLSVLEQEQMIPAPFRPSGFERYAQTRALAAVESAYADDEFVLDPTRLTVYTALTGKSGFEFRSQVLMNELGVQVNHTSINTVLMNATIGVTWGALSFLLDGFRRHAAALEQRLARAGADERRLHEARIRAITSELPPLPDFSGFHPTFRTSAAGEGDLRAAFFLAFVPGAAAYLPLAAAEAALEAGRPLVSTRFVVPYPPGFPILVPGQLISPQIVEFMRRLDVKEVHGYRPELGLSVFTPGALARELHEPPPAPPARTLGEEALPGLH